MERKEEDEVRENKDEVEKRGGSERRRVRQREQQGELAREEYREVERAEESESER